VKTENQWIKDHGVCCIPDCEEDPVAADDMDNVFCVECSEQNRIDQPESWVTERIRGEL